MSLPAPLCRVGAVAVIALVIFAASASAVAFPNPAPLAAQQWYLDKDRAWRYWPAAPILAPVTVAVIDSGVDADHPELRGQIIGGRSFVGGSWKIDRDGHGTFVAGLIAANPASGQGISGIAFNASLLIAKVVRADGSVDVAGEIAAIRWAANQGARVINLSLGGIRDPLDQRLDTYSPAERNAIEYAYARGALVVAAVGNDTTAPAMPWRFADYPAALPHVLGVAALNEDGSVPAFSNRDQRYVDIAAPGSGILSTIPRALVDTTLPGCDGMAYSNCGPAEYRDAVGTSFAAPQVSAAAALLLGQDPRLTPDQVEWLLERSAHDVDAATGCVECPPGRDRFTGWGRLDVQAALTLLANRELPPPDRYEPNDDSGSLAHPFGRPRTISASLDYWDDPIDVYSLPLKQGQRLYARLTPSKPGPLALTLWRPGTRTVVGSSSRASDIVASATAVRGQRRLTYLVPTTGRYYLEASFLPPARPRLTYALAVAVQSAS